MEEESCGVRQSMINNLPDDVLLRIGSLLPLKEAVRTSILSWRWRNLWKPTQLTIRIDQTPCFQDSSQLFTHKFLSSFDSPTSHNVCFLRDYSGEQPTQKDISIMAVKGVQKEVYLQFLSTKETDSLGYELKLNQTLNPKSVEASSSSLRTLHVRSVSNLESSFVSSIFSSCRFLETLKIEKCNNLKSVTVEKNNRLESLIILDCPKIRSVSISAMRMVSFCYRGVLPIIELKNVPMLSEVELDLCGGLYGEFECEDVINLFAAMRDIEKLIITGWLLQWMCSGGVIYGRLEFQFSKLKELTWIDASMDELKRDSLACFLNICPVLTKLFINIKRNRRRVGCPFFHQHWHEPHLWMDYTTMKANVLPLKHLKVAQMSGFSDEKEEEDEMMKLSLLDLFMEKAVMLELMCITSEQIGSNSFNR